MQVEHIGGKSRVLTWTLGKDFEGEWEWNFEHENKMHYGLQYLFVGSFIVLNDDPNQNMECTKRRWE